MADAKKKDTTSIRLSDDDKELFAKAMELEEIDALATWVVRAARLYAKQLLSETDNIGEMLDDLELTLRRDHRELLSELKRLTNPNEHLEG